MSNMVVRQQRLLEMERTRTKDFSVLLIPNFLNSASVIPDVEIRVSGSVEGVKGARSVRKVLRKGGGVCWGLRGCHWASSARDTGSRATRAIKRTRMVSSIYMPV